MREAHLEPSERVKAGKLVGKVREHAIVDHLRTGQEGGGGDRDTAWQRDETKGEEPGEPRAWRDRRGWKEAEQPEFGSSGDVQKEGDEKKIVKHVKLFEAEELAERVWKGAKRAASDLS